jgi:hypothetical protein
VTFFARLFRDRLLRDRRRELVRDRERLAAVSPGGSPARPIAVTSAPVVDVRVRALACPQCEGSYRLVDHRAPKSGLRAADVTCRQCGVARTLWFRLVDGAPN